MSDFVAYYRVSTTKQGESGLGLEGQRHAVASYLKSQQAGSGQPVAEFTEVESGKRSKNRPQLLQALELCKAKKATLVVAKLDRLSRNVTFISRLMDAKVKFIACDMPTATELTIHIYSAIAQHEANLISQRTKAALQVLKARGVQLGNKRWAESIGLASKAKALRPQAPPPAVLTMIKKHRAEQMSLKAIADQLNALGIKTPLGKAWYAMTVQRALTLAA